MTFHEVRFPTNLSYRSRGGPSSNTKIFEADSGIEERSQRWSSLRMKYDAAYAIRSYSDVATVLAFYRARGGPAAGFRFKDWMDFTSTADGRNIAVGGAANPAFGDQVIGTANGSTTVFQLVKKYTSGSTTVTRNIRKPVAGTVLIGVNGVNQTSGWSVDTTTGLVTFTSAPASGQVTWGGEFDVPVRFATEQQDELLDATLADFGWASIESIPIIELFDETIVDDEYPFGGAKPDATISANEQISFLNGFVQRYSATTTGLKLFLPSVDLVPAGGPHCVLSNTGSNAISVRTQADVEIVSMTNGMVVEFSVGVDSNGQKFYLAY